MSIWVAWEVVKEEQAWFAAQPYALDLHDTPRGVFFGAALTTWLVVPLVVNLVLVAVRWWRGKRAKALRLACSNVQPPAGDFEPLLLAPSCRASRTTFGQERSFAGLADCATGRFALQAREGSMAGKFMRRDAVIDTIKSEERTNSIQKRNGTNHPVRTTVCGCPDPRCGAWHTILDPRGP